MFLSLRYPPKEPDPAFKDDEGRPA
jgi:hypothetical protein